MNLEPSPDQELLQKTFSSFFSKESPIDRVRRVMGARGFDDELWRRVVQLGGDALALPADAGGGDGRLVDAVLVGFEAGRCLAPIPLAETVAALRALARVSEEPRAWVDGAAWTIAASTIGWTAWGAAASRVLASTGDGGLAVFATQGVDIRTLDNVGGLPAAIVGLTQEACVQGWASGWEEHNTLAAEIRLLYAAELVGCGRGALELARCHTSERHQFGQPIGSFQAVQHRLVDCLTGLDAAELMVLRAAAYENEGAEFRRRCVAAGLCAARAAEQAAAEALQFFGGHGFVLDNDIHLFLRFAKSRAVIVRHGAQFEPDKTSRRRGRVPDGIDFRRGDEEHDFAVEVRDFLATHLTEQLKADVRRTGGGFDPAFHWAMAENGWVLAALPDPPSGTGLPPAKVAVLWEELYYAEAPVASQQLTETVATIVAHMGSNEQRDMFVRPARRGEWLCAIAYTEPDAGSDVASVATRADRVNGGYVVNGTKLFTTMAQVADHIFLLARTDPAAPKHRGLSTFLIPVHDSGVAIRPLETLGGERTNITTYEDVFVPENMRVGGENDGWAVLNAGLAIERASLAGFVGRARRVLDDLCVALGDATPCQPEIAREWIAIEAAAALCDRVYCRLSSGQVSDVEAAMAKIAVTEAFKGLARRSLDAVGPVSLVAGSSAVADGNLERLYRAAQVATIYAGTSEVLRNLIATRGLRLPR